MKSLKDLGLDNSLPDPVMYQYYKNLKNRKIIINDQIGADIVEMVMIPLLDMDNDGTGKPIEIILNTVGGSLFDGASLCNIIDELKKDNKKVLYINFILLFASAFLYFENSSRNSP